MKIERCTVIFLVGLVLMFSTAHAAVIANHLMTKDPKAGTTCETPVAENTFCYGEEAYCWALVNGTSFGDRIVFKWYGPDSVLYREWANDFIIGGTDCSWSPFDFQSDAPANLFGTWRVDVYYNQVFQFTENFTVLPGPLCPAEVLYGSHSLETELLRYIRDAILVTTPEGRELIRLYYQWSPALSELMSARVEIKQELKEIVDGIVEDMMRLSY